MLSSFGLSFPPVPGLSSSDLPAIGPMLWPAKLPLPSVLDSLRPPCIGVLLLGLKLATSGHTTLPPPFHVLLAQHEHGGAPLHEPWTMPLRFTLRAGALGFSSPQNSLHSWLLPALEGGLRGPPLAEGLGPLIGLVRATGRVFGGWLWQGRC